MGENVFLLPTDRYQRDIDPIRHYIEQSSLFLSKKTGDSLEECREYITQLIREKSYEGITNPKVEFLERNEVGDRELHSTNLSSYISHIVKTKRIFAPTLTVYLHPDEKESVLVNYTEDNIEGRQIAKGQMFEAKAKKDNFRFALKNTEQTNKKLSNNALSGSHVSASTPLVNKTGHSTLTTVTRTTTSFGNANNEKLLAGNRHYRSPDIVMNNITSIIASTDLNSIEQMCSKYNLKYPTVQDAFDCIKRSTQHYWQNPIAENKIAEYLATLTGVERAAFVYVGDLYHIRKYNEEFVRTFVSRLATKVTGKIDNPLDLVKKLDSSELNLAHQLCDKEAKGRGKDYKAMDEAGVLATIVATTNNVHDVLLEYKDFIRTFFTTQNVPASVAYFPMSIRHSALTSDTDSTIFTVQEWVEWYFGEMTVTPESISVASVITFFASQSIVHILALMSANFGFARRFIHEITMKNEFRFDVFVPTQVAKHYFALIGCQEGNVFEEYEEEIKGVHLKNSNTPMVLRKEADKMFSDIMNTVVTNKKISLVAYLNKVRDIENSIIESLNKGDTVFYRFAKIKTPESYTKPPHQSPFFHHMLWNEVFGPTYGAMQEPPYDTVKIPTILANKTALKEWLDSIDDQELKERLAVFLTKYGKTALNTMYVSKSYMRSQGLPKEIIPIINTRAITQDLCITFYIILETLGYYKKPGRLIRELIGE